MAYVQPRILDCKTRPQSDLDEEKLLELCEILDPYRRIRTYGAFLGVRKEEAKPGCSSCLASGLWELLERDVPEVTWNVEYAT